MMEYEEATVPSTVSEMDRRFLMAWTAYADLLRTLRGAIHLDEGTEAIPIALESLLTIGECWALVQSIDERDNVLLPFAHQSEIDLVATLLGLASYSLPFDDSFAEIRDAFLDLTTNSRTNSKSASYTA